MTHRQKDHAILVKPCCDWTRMFACALVVGVLFAVLAGLQTSQPAEGDDANTNASVHLGVAPISAIAGFLAGALAGAVVGFVWTRPGFLGLLGMTLIAAVGGLAGLVVAGLLRAENQTAVTGTAVSMEYGAPPSVMAASGAVGVVVAALAAWQFRRRRSG